MNKSRKIIKKGKDSEKEEMRKKYLKNSFLFFQTCFPAFAYAFIFALQSIIDNSPTFSIELAVFSLFITLSFEINEWNNYACKTDGRVDKIIRKHPPLLSGTFLFVLFAIICSKFLSFINIPENLISVFPNLITSLTLLTYFFSYSVRSYKIKKKEFEG